MASSSNSPCAACKFLRQKCTQECVFAPYFPPDNPQKFSNVHKVFGASNVAKILSSLPPSQREDAANSLAYEGEARLRDPIYGCVHVISFLHQKLKQVQHDLYNAKRELCHYLGPSAMLPLISHQQYPHSHFHNHHMLQQQQNPAILLGPSTTSPYGWGITVGGGSTQNQQMLEAQQLAASVAAREQQQYMLRNIEHHQQHQQQQGLVLFTSGFDGGSGSGGGGGLNQMIPLDNLLNLQHQHQPHQNQQLQLQLQQQQQDRVGKYDDDEEEEEESNDNLSKLRDGPSSSSY